MGSVVEFPIPAKKIVDTDALLLLAKHILEASQIYTLMGDHKESKHLELAAGHIVDACQSLIDKREK